MGLATSQARRRRALHPRIHGRVVTRCRRHRVRRSSSSPGFVPIFAAHDGVIAYAGSPGGNPTVGLEHARGWSTRYIDLEHVLAMPTDRFHRRKTRVRAGDILGHARRSSLRVRFGLAQLGESGWLVADPTEPMHTWSVLPWFDEPTPRAAMRRTASRVNRIAV